MKKTLLILILLGTANIAFAQKAKSDTLTVQTKIYCDHCNECESCRPRIEQELRFAKGVKFSEVNAVNQTVTVIYNPGKTNPEAIRKAIAKSGFDADDIKAKPIDVAKLDGCCQKQ